MLYDSIVRMADVLAYLGIQQNDKIGLCSENSIEFVIIFYACMGLNATVTPINVTYTERNIETFQTLKSYKKFTLTFHSQR